MKKTQGSTQSLWERLRNIKVASVLAGVAIVAVFVGTVWVSVVVAGQGGRDAERVADIQTLQQGLETYYTRNQFFPTSLGALAPKYLSSVPTDPSGKAYLYTAYATSTKACTGGQANGYHLAAALEGHTAASVAGNSDAPAAPPQGSVLCLAGGPTNDSSNGLNNESSGASQNQSGFDGASNKCLSASANMPEGGDNCYDVTYVTNVTH